jgi:hypothetical protein
VVIPTVRGLLAALVLLAGCTRTESAPSEPSPAEVSAAPESASLDTPIDPAPYRAEIEATETVLYTHESLDATNRKELSRALLELHNAIVFRDTSVAARETSRRLFFFSAQVDAEPAPKYSVDELVIMRGVWEKIRAEHFTTVAWFRAVR